MCKLVIVSVFKNCAHCLREWIEHYIREGVDTFLLTDNGSTDAYQDTIKDYVDSGVVSIHIGLDQHKQVEYLNYYLPVAKKYDWILLIDLDEFIYSRKQFKTTKDYLKTIPSTVNKISIPWKMFGSSHCKKQPTGIISHFIRRQKYPKEYSTTDICAIEKKCIVRGNQVKKLGIHNSLLKGDCYNEIIADGNAMNKVFMPITEKLLQDSFLHLNHYRVQSLEMFTKTKMMDGDALNPFYDTIRDKSFFNQFDTNDMLDTELKNKTKGKTQTRRNRKRGTR
jgi:hypothetical protein